MQRGTKQDQIVAALRAAGRVSDEQLRRAQDLVRADRTPGRGVVFHLVDLGILTSEAVLAELERHFRHETIPLKGREPDPELARLLSRTSARALRSVPVELDHTGVLTVAAIDHEQVELDTAIHAETGKRVRLLLTDEHSLAEFTERAYPTTGDLRRVVEAATSEVVSGEEMRALGFNLGSALIEAAASEAATSKAVEVIIREAVRRRASDIHFEFYETFGRIRFRIDGDLREVDRFPDPAVGPALIGRIKYLARMNQGRHLVPHDGTLAHRVGDRAVDLRVSTLPTTTGEAAVLRILDRYDVKLDLATLGMRGDELAHVTRALRLAQGMILVTGPTGSGKSTTLYSCLTRLNPDERCIITVEDPVEQKLPGVRQVQVAPHADPALDLSFATALRAILRQDPNVVMVGEIRDAETARIAFRAAMTGHLVLATVHTNDTASTVTRLLDLGVERYQIGAALSLVIAQRLVKRLCPVCAEPHRPAPGEIRREGFRPEELAGVDLRIGRGCPHCEGTGYRGRVGLYEVMPVRGPVRDAIEEGTTSTELRRRAVEQGRMLPLRAAAIAQLSADLRDGATTLAEVSREINFGHG